MRGKWGSTRNFPITSGVRQGCVLSPRLFSAVLQWAMKSWRRDASLKGFDLGDGQPALLDLRFADDIILFAKSSAESVSLLHDLVTALSQVGFSSHLFSRVGSGWSCLTGQLPGMCHLYTGGSGCAGKQGQVQATAP